MTQFHIRTACLAAGLFVAAHAWAQSEMLIIDNGGDKIARFEVATGEFIDWFCVNHDGGMDGAMHAIFAPNGDLYVTALATDRVRRYNGQTGKYLGDLFSPGQGGLDGPCDIAIGQDGRVYVSSYNNDNVKVFDPALGTVGTFIVNGNNLDGAHGFAQAASGDWYLTSYVTDRVLRYDVNGTFIEIAIGPGVFGLNGPLDILIDEQQRMYVSSQDSDAILVKDLTTGIISQLVPPASGGLDAPRYLSLEPGTNNLLVVANGGNGQFLRFNRTTGTFLGTFLAPLAGGVSGDPNAVVFKPDAVPGCYADCDGDGVLGIDDFICFQTFFAIGC